MDYLIQSRITKRWKAPRKLLSRSIYDTNFLSNRRRFKYSISLSSDFDEAMLGFIMV